MVSTPKPIGTAAGELHVHDAARALAGDEVEVRRLPANDDAQRDDAVELSAGDQPPRGERELEAARNADRFDRRVLDAAVA